MIDNIVPFQAHSRTSAASARAVSKARALSQERWVYETLRASPNGLADWQLWNMVDPFLFEQETSLHRARIELKWRSKKLGATRWHPVEDSGRDIVNPQFNRRTTVWWIKPVFRAVPYAVWERRFRHRAKTIQDL